MTRVLVTGGAGFLGSHVAEACLARGWETWILDDLSAGSLENVPAPVLEAGRFVQADVRGDLSGVAPGQPLDAVFHLGAKINLRESFEQPDLYAAVNVAGACNVARLALDRGARRFVFSSSAAVYGATAPLPIDEESTLAPASPYGRSKLEGEHQLAALASGTSLGLTCLRYANAYGPRQAYSAQTGFLAILVNRAVRGEPVAVFGDGTQTRDFVYASDIAAANLAAFDRELGGTYNVATGVETSLLQAISAVELASARSVEVRFGPANDGEVRRSVLSPAKLNAAGWRAEVAVAEGLARTFEHYRGRLP